MNYSKISKMKRDMLRNNPHIKLFFFEGFYNKKNNNILINEPKQKEEVIEETPHNLEDVLDSILGI